MEPRIQYAKTDDGVSIALHTTGDGTPLVRLPDLPLSRTEPANLYEVRWGQVQQ